MLAPAQPHARRPATRYSAGLHDVLSLKVRIVGRNLLDPAPRTDLSDDSHRHAHAADAGLAAHDIGIVRNSIELLHGAPG
jgi:hypothetical protein